jgi:hypothetical protein
MPSSAVTDPSWIAGDLLEHARRLAALAATPPSERPQDGAVVAGVRELHARCVHLETDPIAAEVRPRDRARLAAAFDGLACASDDLAAIVLLRCAGAPPSPTDGPDLAALLARVGERHDRVVGLLRRAGVQRSFPA